MNNCVATKSIDEHFFTLLHKSKTKAKATIIWKFQKVDFLFFILPQHFTSRNFDKLVAFLVWQIAYGVLHVRGLTLVILMKGFLCSNHNYRARFVRLRNRNFLSTGFRPRIKPFPCRIFSITCSFQQLPSNVTRRKQLNRVWNDVIWDWREQLRSFAFISLIWTRIVSSTS